MPFWVAWPPTVQTGRSDPILIVPLAVPVPPLPPQANATSAAEMRTVSPLARTIWFPLVFVERHATTRPQPPLHLPPSSQLLSGRECAGGECGHMGWPNDYSGANFSIGLTKLGWIRFGSGCGAPSIWECGAVINGFDPGPAHARARGDRLLDRDHSPARVAFGVEAKGAGHTLKRGR